MNKNEKLKRFLLISMIENNDISFLENIGYTYLEIISEYHKLIEENFITIKENLSFELTEKGNSELKELNTKFYNKGNAKIELYEKYKTTKMNKYDIFIE